MRIIFIGILLLPLVLMAEIEVTDTQGRSMTVDILSFNKTTREVKLRRTSDSAVFSVSLDVFASESQAEILKVAPRPKANLLSKVSVSRRRRDVKDSFYMEIQTISAKAIIENDSRDLDFADGEGTLFLIARETKRYANRDEDYGKVLQRESFPISVKSGEVFEFENTPVQTKYDSDKDYTNVGGWEYYGWVLIIQKADGTVHTTATSIGNLQKEVEENPELGVAFLKLKEEELVEKNLERRTK